MAGACCEGGMVWRREKEVVIQKALPGSEGLTPGELKRVWKLIYRQMLKSINSVWNKTKQSFKYEKHYLLVFSSSIILVNCLNISPNLLIDKIIEPGFFIVLCTESNCATVIPE